MTKLTSLFLIIIFLISVFIGITVGMTFKTSKEDSIPTATTASTPTASRTILVLGVNNFIDEQIFLESAWQVTIHQTQRAGENIIEVLAVSIYPLSVDQVIYPNQSQYLEPHAPIVFPKDFLDNLTVQEWLSTIPLLNQTDLFYQDVIVIDEYAMNYIIALVNENPILPTAGPSEDTFTKPWEQPERALAIQHNLIEILCAPPQYILGQQNFSLVFYLMPDHFKSTFAAAAIVEFWQTSINLVTPPNITCSIYP